LQAVQWAEDNQFARAVRLLKRTSAPPLSGERARGTVRRQRLAWLAQWTYRAGRPGRARHYARRAAQAYRAYGDRDAAARWETFAAKMQWVRSGRRIADGARRLFLPEEAVANRG
jgi:hypothetical protein